jgi:phosphoglycerol transferase MdoB-like AlkP superfamily enzyme
MALFFLAFQLFVRISFIIWQFKDIEISVLESLEMFAVGTWFDIVALSFFMIPYVLYLVFLPKKFHLGKFDHAFTRICYVILLYLLAYDVVAQWVFWDEFHVRYNFIAVDYLVYTTEVLANIWQSYPIVWLLLGIAGITAVIYYYTKNLFLSKTAGKVANFFRRATWGFVYFSVCTLFFLGSNLNQAEISQNNFVNEISKNGVFSLFSAFRNNELDYEKFYLAEYQDKKLPTMQELMEEDEQNVSFVSKDFNDITRFVPANGKENRKNVIIVLMESLSANYMGSFGGAADSTPNLDLLSKESIFFTNFYATGTRTVRGMEAITLSTPPTPGRSIVKRPNNENLFSLGFVFQDRDYDTKFLYGGNGYFDNMNYFFENNGFETVDLKNFSKDEQTFGNAWGLCDEDLFNKTILEANKSHKENKPFMSLVMTTSNHRPYTFPPNDAGIPVEGGGRGAGVKYADYAIGKFIENAKKQPWFNNTVFIFVADHTAGSAGKEELTPEKYHIPFLIYSPNFVSPKIFSHFASQIDVAPTLLGLLNFSYYSRFYGENVLEDFDEDPHSFIANYQKMGYEKDGILTILKPNKQFAQYENGKLLEKVDEDLLLETIAFYKNAANWKKYSTRINTITGEKF